MTLQGDSRAGDQAVELESNLCKVCSFIITEKASSRAFAWLKMPASAFTSKNLLRHSLTSVGAFNQEKALVGAFVIVNLQTSLARYSPVAC